MTTNTLPSLDDVTTSPPASSRPDRRFAGGLLIAVLSGSLIANGVPHLWFAVSGQQHATPFGASSSPAVNLAWSLANLGLGIALTVPLSRLRLRPVPLVVASLVGAAGTIASLVVLWR